MREKILFGIFIFAGMLFANAEIMLNTPESVYFLGDSINIHLTTKPNQDLQGFLEISLICSNSNYTFYKSPENLQQNQEKTIASSLFLTKNLVSQEDSCYIKSVFEGESSQTQKFLVSRKIDLSLLLKSSELNPGENVSLSGIAKKSSKNVEGFAEISFENTSIIAIISNSSFNVDIPLQSNLKSGNHLISVKAYEKYKNEITNFGESNIIFEVKQVPSKIVIYSENQTIPENDFSYKANIFDQAGDSFSGDISLAIYDSSSKKLTEKISKTETTEKIYLNANALPGDWKIVAQGFGLSSEKAFIVSDYEKISMVIVNKTNKGDKKLVVSNLGNIPYNKPLQINIGNYSEVTVINLNVGESIDLPLSAPEGEYEISASDGKNELKQTAILTGKVIGVNKKQNSEYSFFSKYPIMWLFLITICGLFVFSFSRKVVKRDSYAYPSNEKRAVKQETRTESKPEKKEKVLDLSNFSSQNITKAEHVVVLDGRKERTAVVALKLKDLNFVESSIKETISKIEGIITGLKGTVYSSNGYIIGIFSSLTTRTFDNEKIALKASKEIESTLQNHNNLMKNKLDFGLSLNSGELILKKEKELLNFTNIASTIPEAKKIAEIANNEVLLSESFSRKISSEAKSEKVSDGVYKITRLTNSEKHSQFISDFLNRQSKL